MRYTPANLTQLPHRIDPDYNEYFNNVEDASRGFQYTPEELAMIFPEYFQNITIRVSNDVEASHDVQQSYKDDEYNDVRVLLFTPRPSSDKILRKHTK